MISEPGTALESSELLDICDRALGEVGRRSHLFSWLRPDGANSEGWLAVDSYYPRRRVVVLCRERDDQYTELYSKLIPEHGMRLIALSPRELGGDRTRVRQEIGALVEQVAPAPPPPPVTEATTPRPSRALNVAQAAAALAPPAPAPSPRPRQLGASHAAAVARGSRFASASGASRARHPAPVRPPRPRAPRPAPLRVKPQDPDVEAVGLFLGLSLVCLLLIETYLDVAKLALDAGQLVLAFGVAIDAVARALGTVAARRAGSTQWAWGCAVGGSPAVMAFTLFGRDGPIAADPAPLAGLLSLLACTLIALAALGAALGI